MVFTHDSRFAFVSAQPLLDDPPGATGDEPGLVVQIDTASHTIGQQIPVGRRPGSLAISPNGAFVYVANMSSDSISVIETSTNEVRATIPLGRPPTNLTVSPDGRFVYATTTAQEILVIDPGAGLMVERIPLPFFPEDIAIVETSGGCSQPPPTPVPTPGVAPPAPGVCIGDCNGDLTTSVDELLLATGIALEQFPADSCSVADWNRDGNVSVDELIEAVRNAIDGCSLFFCPF